MLNDTIKALIEHVCGQAGFDEDKAYEGLEGVIEFDWQKRFVRLLERLADEVTPEASRSLTAEQKAKYLESGGRGCPFCGSDDIEGDRIDAEGDTVAQRVRCLDCGKAWDDVYALSDVEEVDEYGNTLPDLKDPDENHKTVELNNGGCLEWDNGTIRYVDCDGNTEGVWEPGDDGYDTYKSQYFPTHTVTRTEDDEEA